MKNFFKFLSNTIRIFSFISKRIYNLEKIEALENSKLNFWDKCISTISNIESLRWENNVKSPENDLINNYLNDKEIKDKIISNFNNILKQKKIGSNKSNKGFSY